MVLLCHRFRYKSNKDRRDLTVVEADSFGVECMDSNKEVVGTASVGCMKQGLVAESRLP